MKNRKWLIALTVIAVAAGSLLWRKVATNVGTAPKGAAHEMSQCSAETIATPSSLAGATVALAAAASPTVQVETVNGTLPYVLTSVKSFDATLRKAAELTGAKTLGVLSRNTLLVEADKSTHARLMAMGKFAAITELAPSAKIDPELAALLARGAAQVDVSIVSLSGEYRGVVLDCLRNGGGELLKGCINEGDTIRARLPAALVAKLASCGEVRWMETFERPHLMNDRAVLPEMMDVKQVWKAHKLTGKGQSVSTSDSGIDTGIAETMHKDLCERVKEILVVDGCISNDVSGHGTHTAGSIVGDGTLSKGQIRGTAYGADLYAWFCSTGGSGIYLPSNMPALFTADGAWPAYIHSASWGSSTKGKYDTECVDVDKYTWEHPEFLPVFSAGNDGSKSKTVGSPAAAKNVLSVGATQSSRHGYDGGWGNGDPKETATFSSRGPCQDGRIKPEISAPGVGILSTRSYRASYSYGVYTSNTNYAFDSGTSMSCPLTAGAVALVRQWLVEEKGFADADGERPTAALMKAVIMGGAKDAAVPNDDQGWGRVDLANTLFPTNGCAVKLVDRIPVANGFVTNIVVETTNAAPLDVQLVWVDYPGSAGGAQSVAKLVNDLDLTVEAHAEGAPPLCYGNGGTEPDTLNNAESVHLTCAVPTKYVITVDCRHIVHEHNATNGAAALYIRGAFDPDRAVDVPEYVRIKERGMGFIRLDAALNAVQNGETVELLDWASLAKSVEITNSCTIVATNADAAVSYVQRWNDATLTVAKDVTLTLTNVTFTGSTEALVAVEKEGRLRIAQRVDLGLDMDHLAVTTADAKGLDIAGDIKRKFLLHCDVATNMTEQFGTYSCDARVAASNAVKVVCWDDLDRETRGEMGATAGTLVWGHAYVPLDEAAGYFVDDTGWTNTFARHVKAIPAFKKSYEARKTSAFLVRRDGPMTDAFSVTMPLVMRGVEGLSPMLTVSSDAGFDISSGGVLTFSNLVFKGCARTAGKSFVAVKDGTFTLADGATIDGFTGHVDEMSGTVDIYTGTMNMLNGAMIRNCRAEGAARKGGKGGAIHVDCNTAATLNLLGGTITNCYASTEGCGGGVFVYNYSKPWSPVVNISGDLDIRNNASAGKRDDICLYSGKLLDKFRMIGAVEGTVGIRYGTGSDANNKAGAAFMTNACAFASSEPLYEIFNDTDEKLFGAVGANGLLVWTKDLRDARICDDPDEACAKIIYPNGTSNFWYEVQDALVAATNKCIVEILQDDVLNDNIAITGNILLRSADAAPYGYTLGRETDAKIEVPAGCTLVVENVEISGISGGGIVSSLSVAADEQDSMSTVPLFDVDGGVLKLDGVYIGDIYGTGNRDANAVTVHNGGSLEAINSQISGCYNYFAHAEKDSENGVGAGLLIDHGTAVLRDVFVSNCYAMRCGGVYVCNDSLVQVADHVCACDNGTLAGVCCDVMVSDDSRLVVTNALTGIIYATPGYQADTNIAAHVSSSWNWSVGDLTNAAACFKHDLTRHYAVAVTNGTEALFVWCDAVQDGVYTLDDKVYGLAGTLPDVRQCDMDDWSKALASITDVAGAQSYWWRVKDALNEASANCAVDVYGNDTLDADIFARGTNVIWRAADYDNHGFTLSCAQGVRVLVTNGAEVAMRQMAFAPTGGFTNAAPLITVDASMLRMTDSSIIGFTADVASNATALAVQNGAKLVLDGVTEVHSCTNVSPLACAKVNVAISADSGIEVDEEVRGGVALSLDAAGDTNLVARVSTNWVWTVEGLTNSAASFFNDADTNAFASAVAVTNGTKALIVWCGAVRNGKYVNASDKVVYGAVTRSGPAPTVVLPQLDDLATPAQIKAELDKLLDVRVADQITTIEEYKDFCTWAQSVPGGADAVVASSHAMQSYAFGVAALFENDPTIQITQVAAASGGLSVKVVVKDGADAVVVASAKVKEMFEATRDVTDWTKTLDITVSDLTQGAANEVSFTVVPTSASPSAFIRLKY